MKRVVLLAMVLVLVLSAPALAARSGGTLNTMAPYGGSIFSFDPHITTRYQDALVYLNIHRCLYRWDPTKSVPVPDLAESASVSDDGLVYTYKLRSNIKFHNGRQMTADDVIWSYNRISGLKPASPWADNVRQIKGAKEVEDGKAETISGLKKIDDLTFEMTLANPVDIKYHLWLPGTAILPKEEVEKEGANFKTNPVGLGPFKLEKWVKGSEVILAKNADYYLEGRPYLDKLVFKIMPEAAPRDLAFKAKDLDVTLVGSVNYPEYSNDPVISKNMIEVAEVFTRLAGMNPDFKPFSNKLVRQAICYALPADLMIKKLLKNKAFPPRGYLPPTVPAFNPKIKKYEFNPEKAKRLMKEAGYADGFVVENCIGTNNKSWGATIFEAMMPYLKKLNITLKVQQLDGAAFQAKVRAGEWNMFMWSLDSGPDPLRALERWKGDNSQSSGNYVKYNNPEYDKYLSLAAAERDLQKHIDYLQKAEALLVEDAPIWFFNYNKAVLAFQPWVHGLSAIAPEMMFQDFTSVWVEDSSPRASAK